MLTSMLISMLTSMLNAGNFNWTNMHLTFHNRNRNGLVNQETSLLSKSTTALNQNPHSKLSWTLSNSLRLNTIPNLKTPFLDSLKHRELWAKLWDSSCITLYYGINQDHCGQNCEKNWVCRQAHTGLKKMFKSERTKGKDIGLNLCHKTNREESH